MFKYIIEFIIFDILNMEILIKVTLCFILFISLYVILSIFMFRTIHKICKSRFIIMIISFPATYFWKIYYKEQWEKAKEILKSDEQYKKDNIIKNFEKYTDSSNSHELSSIILSLSIYLGVNNVTKPKSQKVSKLITMHNWIWNWDFSDFWELTNFRSSGWKDVTDSDIKNLADFLDELKLYDIKQYILQNYNVYKEIFIAEMEWEKQNLNSEKILTLEESYDNKLKEIEKKYVYNEEKLNKSLFVYCKSNLDEII